MRNRDSTPKTVVILEDNPDEILITRMFLRRDPQGFEFLFFQTFPEVEAEIDARLADGRPPPDVIVTDMNMPRCNGVDVLIALREKLEPAETCIGIYTGLVDKRVMGALSSAKADFLLEKPLSPAKLRQAIAMKASAPIITGHGAAATASAAQADLSEGGS